MHLMLENHQRNNVAIWRKIPSRVKLSFERFYIQCLVGRQGLRSSRVGDDGVAHVPDRTGSARYVPAAPTLLDGAAIIRNIVTQLAHRVTIRPGKHTAN